jgi:hypothetical protein
MMNKSIPDWLELSLKGSLDGYCDHFGYPFPRPQLVKFAYVFGGMEAIKQLLNEHVLADQRVNDWDAFARELHKRKGRGRI